MNKLLLRLSAVTLTLGMLGAAACSACNPPPPDPKAAAALQQQSMNCGAYTHRVGNQCVGDTQSGTTSSSSNQPSTLKTTGNN